MNKATYQDKFATLATTDETTVLELKAKRKTETQLRAYLKKTAITWLEKNELKTTYKDWIVGWHHAKFAYDIKPTGAVTVELFNADDYTGLTLYKTVRIPKNNLFN